MNEIVEKLAESLVAAGDASFRCERQMPANLQDSYRYFLSLCDGGYTADHFLHFFGQGGPSQHNLLAWNQCELWKKYYGLDDKTFMFAEDAIGTQFCFDVRGNGRVVKIFTPDGGKLALCANTFEEFLEVEVLDDSTNAQVRQLVQRFFQQTGVAFRPFMHIGCKIPVSLGGSDTDFSNLELIRSSTHMRMLGQITTQIKNFPPGTRIKNIQVDNEMEEIILVPEHRS